VRERPKSGHRAIRLPGAGRVAAGIALAAVLIAACSGPGLRAGTGARALVSGAQPKDLVSCIVAPDVRSTGIGEWDTPIGFALDMYYNHAHRPLTIKSVSLIDSHNLVLHGALLYKMPHSQRPLIQETAWDRLSQSAQPNSWAARQAIPGAVMLPERPVHATGTVARDIYQLVLDISSRTPQGGWAAGEIVRYSSGGQRYTVTTYTGYAIAPPPYSAPKWCGPQSNAIRHAWRKMK
jgi:hypothetical protein